MAMDDVKNADSDKEGMVGSVQKQKTFEGCFANGLDLSEFDTTNVTTSVGKVDVMPTSHSTKLLEIRKQEAIQREYEINEDRRLEMLARNRAQQIQNFQAEGTDKSGTNNPNSTVLLAKSPTEVSSSSSSSGHLEIIGHTSNSANGGFLQELILSGMHNRGNEVCRQQKTATKRSRTLQQTRQERYTSNSRLSNNHTMNKKNAPINKKSRKSKY